MKLWTN